MSSWRRPCCAIRCGRDSGSCCSPRLSWQKGGGRRPRCPARARRDVPGQLIRVEPGERLHRLAEAAQRGDLADAWVGPPGADGWPVLPRVVAWAGGSAAVPAGPNGTGAGAGRRPPPRAPLPLPMTALIGREQLLTVVDRLLASRQLVTLTGPGGSGKTRLAIAAARLERR